MSIFMETATVIGVSVTMGLLWLGSLHILFPGPVKAELPHRR